MKNNELATPQSKYDTLPDHPTPGQPLKFKSPEELQKKIDTYFKECDEGKEITVIKKGKAVTTKQIRPYTIEGLCVALDCDRLTLLNYAKHELFFNTITRAKRKIHAHKLEKGLTGELDPRMVQFDLINNANYTSDKSVNLNMNVNAAPETLTDKQKEETQRIIDDTLRKTKMINTTNKA